MISFKKIISSQQLNFFQESPRRLRLAKRPQSADTINKITKSRHISFDFNDQQIETGKYKRKTSFIFVHLSKYVLNDLFVPLNFLVNQCLELYNYGIILNEIYSNFKNIMKQRNYD